MAEKQKSAQRSRAHKESKHTGRGARPFPNGGMNEVQKILISNGGMAHSRLRRGKATIGATPKRRPKEL